MIVMIMKLHKISIMAIAAGMLVSCSDSDMPSAKLSNAEMPEIKVNIDGVDSWIESRSGDDVDGEVIASCVTKDTDGTEYKVEVVSEKLDDRKMLSRADGNGIFDDVKHTHEIRVFGWMKENINSLYPKEILYVDGIIERMRADRTNPNPKWGDLRPNYAYTDQGVTGYRWPGNGAPMAFVGVYAQRIEYDTDQNEYTDAEVDAHNVIYIPSSNNATQLAVTVFNEGKFNRPLAFAARGTEPGFGINENDQVTLSFGLATAAVEVIAQGELFNGKTIKRIKLNGVMTQGHFYVAQKKVYDMKAVMPPTLNEIFSTTNSRLVQGSKTGMDYVETTTLDRAIESASSIKQVSLNPDNFLYVLPQKVNASNDFYLEIWRQVGVSQERSTTLKLPALEFKAGVKLAIHIKLNQLPS